MGIRLAVSFGQPFVGMMLNSKGAYGLDGLVNLLVNLNMATNTPSPLGIEFVEYRVLC